MINKTDKEQFETHPHLPSGEWEGFYCYNNNPAQHKMHIELNFSKGIISGLGVDDVSSFTWKGKYDIEKFKADMTKHYSTHKVWYKGDIDENGIWGIWEIVHDLSKFPQFFVEMIKEQMKNESTGGFHIWPKKRKANSNSVEAEAESEKLKEIFEEVFTG